MPRRRGGSPMTSCSSGVSVPARPHIVAANGTFPAMMGNVPSLTESRLRRRLASFHRRRIAIPVGPDSLVLDVGSGDKPHWRADVLLDRYVDAVYGGQRSGRAAARITRPMFDADAA